MCIMLFANEAAKKKDLLGKIKRKEKARIKSVSTGTIESVVLVARGG